MKKILSVILLALSLGQTALASHPHDRVCVAKIGGANETGSLEIIFQYSIGRTYQKGDSSIDPHEIAAQASYSSGDYLSNPPTKFKSTKTILQPDSSSIIPMTLVGLNNNGEKKTLFTGTFDIDNEKLNGTFINWLDTKITMNVQLTCISQPALKLEPTDVGILD